MQNTKPDNGERLQYKDKIQLLELVVWKAHLATKKGPSSATWEYLS